MKIVSHLLLTFTLLCCVRCAFADGPADNQPESVRRVPRLGIEVSADDRGQLERGLASLAEKIADVRAGKDAHAKTLLVDVVIFHRAVDTALTHQEFFAQGEIAAAKRLLVEGNLRAEALLAGKSPWTTQTGLVVRGYVSRIDGTPQPYGMVIPAGYAAQGTDQLRLDLWFHGRGETLSEVKFIDSRMRQVGQFSPPRTFVLHPYGRYSNAFKFAGEVDVLEALADAQRRYRVDPDRISSRGFSMGGAACWQFAVHYSDRWFACNPGAGFSETPEFLKFFQKETLNPTWFERKLWRMYDCNGYARNLIHCPTVAYSGEFDIQKQAADIMEEALAKEGIDMVHIIGPQTKHAIHAQSKLLIERRLASLAERGRQRMPSTVHLQTHTLKYNRMHWVRIDALEEHWEEARVDASLARRGRVSVMTKNVASLTLSMAPGFCPFPIDKPVIVTIDGDEITAPRPKSDRSWTCRLHRQEGAWRLGPAPSEGLRKRHNLQGPIDDAFMDSFIFVRPTGVSKNELVERWTRSELRRAIEHWRRHFRGDARVKDDKDITEEDIAHANLVIFGDLQSNSLLARLADQLPIQWGAEEISVGERRFTAAHHAPVMIYPNPLNPARYVVLNSSFTYREFAYLNNARQVPMLPDWAIVDLRTAPGSQWPGEIAAADFFNESWGLKPPHEE